MHGLHLTQRPTKAPPVLILLLPSPSNRTRPCSTVVSAFVTIMKCLRQTTCKEASFHSRVLSSHQAGTTGSTSGGGLLPGRDLRLYRHLLTRVRECRCLSATSPYRASRIHPGLCSLMQPHRFPKPQPQTPLLDSLPSTTHRRLQGPALT